MSRQPMLNVERRGRARPRVERAEARERHLAERELAAPAGEHVTETAQSAKARIVA